MPCSSDTPTTSIPSLNSSASSLSPNGSLNGSLDGSSSTLPSPQSFSFACGGWLQFYLFGVAKYIQQHKLHHNTIICGCSAGALAATGLICEGNFDEAVEFCKDDCIPRTYNRITGIFRLHEYVNDCLDHACNLQNYQQIKEGALRISVTSLPFFSCPFSR